MACLSLIKDSSFSSKDYFMNRVIERNGEHTLMYASEFNIGSLEYELVYID